MLAKARGREGGILSNYQNNELPTQKLLKHYRAKATIGKHRHARRARVYSFVN